MSAQRLTDLVVRRLDDGMRELLEPLEVVVDDRVFVVPKGFVTDYSSYPTIASWVVRWDRVDIAGVVHDWLFRCGPDDIGYWEANSIWRKVARSGKRRANFVQGWVSWTGLSMGGWIQWRRLAPLRKLEKCCLQIPDDD